MDPARLDAFHRVLLARAWESQRRHTEARYQQVLISCLTPTTHDIAARAALSAAAGELEDYARAEELRLALGLSPGQLHHQAAHAQALDGLYRAAREELSSGRMSVAQVRELVKETRAVPTEVLAEVLERALRHAETQTTSEFRATVRRAVTKLVPDQAAREFTDARARRSVRVDDDEIDVVDAAGQRVVRASSVTATTDPTQARRIHQLIEGEALRLRAAARRATVVAHEEALAAYQGLRKQPATSSGDALDAAAATIAAARTERARVRVRAIGMGAWRVDALEHLLELGTLAARDGKALTAHGRPVELVVVVGVDTLLGLAEDPAELRGYGALPAPVLADLTSAAARWLVTCTDRHGRPVATQRYRATQAIQDWITAVHPTCTAPHCTTSVEWCERDHTEPYDHDDPAAGGATDTENQQPRCTGHHQLKSHGGYRVTSHDDGSLTTTTPAGHTYRTPPPEVLPTCGLQPRAAPPRVTTPTPDHPRPWPRTTPRRFDRASVRHEVIPVGVHRTLPGRRRRAEPSRRLVPSEA